MGYIEETGAAQYYRDARILTIYEGTTAIQANDLVGRKTARDGGATARTIVAAVRETQTRLAAVSGDEDCAAIGKRLAAAVEALGEVVDHVVANVKSDEKTAVRAVYAGSVPYLKLAGIVLGGWQMGRAALAARAKLDHGVDHSVDQGGAVGVDVDFYRAKIATALFFADHFLTQAGGLRDSIVEGARGALALNAEQF
jgi:butyryl-CoA dehydrogenase